MVEPFIFVGSHRVREGKLQEFRADAVALARMVEEREPQLLGFNIFLSDDGTEATVVQIHPDADSMLFHMQVVRDHITEAYADSLDATTSMHVYGPPSDTVLEMIRQFSTPEVPLGIKARHLAGFTRSAAD